MTTETIVFATVLACATLAGGHLYRVLWIRQRGTETIPTGFGAFIAVALLLAAAVFHPSGRILGVFAILVVATAIYWLDDAFGLSARFRMGLSFLSGILICAVLVSELNDVPVGLLALLCLVAGFVNVLLTNVVNFYDGADLNLATFIALTCGFVLLFSTGRDFIALSAVACSAFIVPFAFMNRRPRTIYLGDAGSFAFATFVTTMVIIYFAAPQQLAAEVAIPLGFPIVDTFYVFCYRIIKRHDLLTRNYLHLYQKLNSHYMGFGYLLPQVASAFLALTGSQVLRRYGLSDFWAVAIAMVVVTIPFYFACRQFLLPRVDVGTPA